MTRGERKTINEEAIAYYADRLLSYVLIRDIIYTDILIYISEGGDKMKVKYTYQTDAVRLQLLKIIAVQKNCPVNKLLDEIVDAFIKKEKKA